MAKSTRTQKRIHVIDDTQVVWERMPWDTARGYEYYLVYFNLPDGERQLWRAYEKATGRKATKKKDGRRRIPSNWYRYFRGDTNQSNGDIIKHFFTYDVDESDPRYGVVYPAPNWAGRVQAYLDHLEALKREHAERTLIDEAEQISLGMRQASRLILSKLLVSLQAYSGTHDHLPDLVRMFHTVVDDMHRLYKLESDAVDDAPADVDDDRRQMTDNERLLEILKLYQNARDASSD